MAIEVLRKYGSSDLILLNHDIHPSVEDADVKRFKRDVAAHCGVEITYANMSGWDRKDQLDISIEEDAFKTNRGKALCTNRLKTAPFDRWLIENQPDTSCVIYYGFDASEQVRILRRSSIMAAKGYRTAFPLAFWERTIHSTTEIGIAPPLTYGVFKHANCVGCLKAGMQHWYVVFCTRPDIWEKAKLAEDAIDHPIIKDHFLADLEPRFMAMRCAGIEPTEKMQAQTFWAQAKKILKVAEDSNLPCECAA